MVNVTVKNQIFKVPKGKLLSEFLIDNGFSVAHTCGGRGVCGRCRVKVNGESVLSCKYVINADIIVDLPLYSDIESVTGVDATDKITQNMCYALDIGTTTLALALVSLDNNEVVRVETCTNPQVSFGGDVISRIDYCRHNDVKKLQKSVVEGINKLLKNLGDIYCDNMFVSGNTTMLHILLGKDPSPMGVAPYKPAFLNSQKVCGKAMDISSVKNIITLPCISAFVGADLVAGLNLVGLPVANKYNLLVDLGTNAEIILFSENKILCTSAAAGPCFEGANISCGISATEGAVCSFKFNNENKIVKTISDAEPRGICGTGLVDIISELLKNNIMDETGYMDCETYNITETVYINQKDIRQYQLAKSAVYSAILTLMAEAEIGFDRIDKMYISGGFSAKINIQNAVATGLLPRELKEKTEPINNSSLLGTIKFCIENNQLQKYLQNAEYVDLSLNTQFSELFIENMEF